MGLDPDEAGEKSSKRLKYNLKNKVVTEFIIPKNKDINDLTESEFLNLEEVY